VSFGTCRFGSATGFSLCRFRSSVREEGAVGPKSVRSRTGRIVVVRGSANNDTGLRHRARRALGGSARGRTMPAAFAGQQHRVQIAFSMTSSRARIHAHDLRTSCPQSFDVGVKLEHVGQHRQGSGPWLAKSRGGVSADGRKCRVVPVRADSGAAVGCWFAGFFD